ncbi:MAG: DUF58 domain-containing protein [Eubacterium sp.]|nr:DUF58 domain-containing protein [Eubacterium sp.]
MFKKIKNKGVKPGIETLKHRVTVPRVIYAVLLIGTCILVSNKGGAFSYVLFFSVLLYAPIAFAYILYTMWALHVYQEMEGRLLYKNTAKNYQIQIENAGVLPLSGIRLLYSNVTTHFKEDFTTDSFQLMSRESINIETELTCRYAGNYTAGIEKIVVEDFFGIFKIRFHLQTPLRVSVLPVVTDIAVKDITRILDESRLGRNIFRLDITENFLGNDLRKYMQGDSLNTIHWKNYARTGELMVRLPERQNSDMLSLILVTEDTGDDEENIKRRDLYLEYLVSVADYFAHMKKPVRIIYPDSGIKTFTIEDYKSFREFYHDRLRRIHGAIDEDTEKAMLDKSLESLSVRVMFREKDNALCLI